MIDCYYKFTANRGIILWVFPWWCYTWLHVMIHYIILNYNFKLSIKNDTVNHLLNKAKPFVINQTKFGCFYFLTTWMCNMELADNSWSVISVTYSHIHDLSFILQRHFFRLRLQLKCDVLWFRRIIYRTCLTSLSIVFKGLVCWVFKLFV